MQRPVRPHLTPVQGVIAPPARPTAAGAFWLASLISLPVGAALLLLQTLWDWLG